MSLVEMATNGNGGEHLHLLRHAQKTRLPTLAPPSPAALAPPSPARLSAYRLDVQAAVRAWSVWRRYSQFDQLHRDLLRIHPQHPPPVPLPAKHYFSFTSTASSPAYIEQRRHGLEKYVQALLNDPDPRWRRTHEWREFLGVPTARAFTEDHFTAGSWMEELRAVQGALRECRALVHRREASAARKNTAEVHRCTQDARRRLQGLAEQVRALEAGLKSLAISRRAGGGGGGDDDDDEGDERGGRPTVASNHGDRRDLLQQHDGTGNAYGYSSPDSHSSTASPRPGMARGSTAPATDLSTSPSSSSSPTAAAAAGPQSRRVFGRAATALMPETSETRALDNGELLQHQQTLMQRQDNHMSQLSSVLQQQRQIALAVGDELDMQNQMLDELDADVEQVASKLNRAGRQLDKIR
ncbi:hypothetical protein SYNPS1DRAFT_26617 [Syncephalis pseudoplumigaleata]|uniref:Phox homologous domain-containing protein n=1 Tax=Syncephalis pseudoplumigaleata TaxID=1712513 RepID=A0A4P9Z554_9FUNG|nr:hypothetical protein SYNPS1DRAFT_26617 [Syncephalis pseudoplumigaleata]|eukprot:RKP27744.1 hypothetical protein SYNPS1DRAFT_26617 [Syncephalis pseudoplumigaleata]